MDDMKEGIAFAHEHGVRRNGPCNGQYNTKKGVREYLKELKRVRPMALIIADPAIFEMAKKICPEIERHVSTQANNTNYGTYQFWCGSVCGICQRTVAGRDQRDPCQYPQKRGMESFILAEQCAFPIPEDAC